MTGYKGLAIPDRCEPVPTGNRVVKPRWWFALITEDELHSRVKSIAEKRAKELAYFGGK